MTTLDKAGKLEAQLQQERSWLRQRMAGDARFYTYRSVRRDYAYVGRKFVAWRIANGQPVIKAVIRAEQISISPDEGLCLVLGVQRPWDSTPSRVYVMSQPTWLEEFQMYLWMPSFADVHFVPFDMGDPTSPRRTSVPLMSRTPTHPNDGQVEGATYFSPSKVFGDIWPEFKFV